MAYPTDIRMLETARAKLVEAAKANGIDLKQTYAKEGRALSAQAGRYAHARQFRRMRRAIKRQRTLVGRLQREVQRKSTPEMADVLRDTLAKAARVVEQTRHRKTPDPAGKLYSWHAPEVRCFSKGKARTPFEFGAKVGLATTVRGNLIVGARAWSGAPYDGHTLHEQIEQSAILMEASNTTPTKAVVDLGYRGAWRPTTRA